MNWPACPKCGSTHVFPLEPFAFDTDPRLSSGGAILESTGPRKTPYECKICGTKFGFPDPIKSPDQEGASLIRGLQAGTTETRRDALESLCRRYWKPVYNYVRRAHSKTSDEAKDLTQGFFLWLFEAEPLRRYSPDKARFRGFLKHILRGFLSDQTDYNEAAKRGGRMKVVSLDQIPNLESYLADNRSAKPEEVFDWAWKKELLDRAIERAREWFLSTGRANQFRAFEEFDLSADRDQKTMGQVGEKLGVKESDVRNYLHAVREQIRQEIRSEIAQTVSSQDSLDEEWNELFGPEDLVARMGNILKAHETEHSSLESPQSRYQILDHISRGGMGVIHRAWDRRLGRQVAFKILLGQAEAEPDAYARFVQEAQLAARLSHPNIVAIYDVGKWLDHPYIAMQLVDGTTIGKARLGRTDIILALRDIARALHYAHENKVVHRDVKPANILVDKAGRAYLTDFGVARRTAGASKITLTGMTVGTPVYMSPEQARGRSVDPRTDIYSLGATLFELMSGTPPFSGADSMEVLRQVIDEGPPTPRTIHRSTPREIETIILKAMEKDPAKRYQTAAELADDLQRYLDGDPILARGPGPLYLGWKKVRRHPMAAIAGVLSIALVLVLGFVLAE